MFRFGFLLFPKLRSLSFSLYVFLSYQLQHSLHGESVVIDRKERHRVKNLGTEVLEIIEIQTGTYFGEDDIIRFEDIYGRKDFH